jgi:septal ring factor EnvC (AmiA/AmiB activator)
MTPRLIPVPAALAGLALAAAALAATPAPLARLNLQETELTADQAKNMSELSRLLTVLVRLRRDPPPALLVPAAQARDAVRAAILVKAMTPELQRRAEAFSADAADMARQRRLAAVESEALFTRDSEAAEAAAPLRAQGPGRRARAPVLLGPSAPPARLLAPVPGPVVRRFGDRLPSGGRSDGITLAAPRAGRVAAPAAGLVQYAGPVKGWGVILILRLSGGYHLVLAGLDRSSASVGQSVAAGQTVGWMPDARQSSPELYLEVRDDGEPVDPSRWLEAKAG